jgi:hypothetical protein
MDCDQSGALSAYFPDGGLPARRFVGLQGASSLIAAVVRLFSCRIALSRASYVPITVSFYAADCNREHFVKDRGQPHDPAEIDLISFTDKDSKNVPILT